jgi:SpoIID/LytB domain protein
MLGGPLLAALLLVAAGAAPPNGRAAGRPAAPTAATRPVAPAPDAATRPVAPVPPAADPAPIPSGLDLLYGDRVAVTPRGEPLVTIGLATGERHVTLRSRTTLQVDFWEAGVLKRASVRPGDAVEVSVRRATPAARQYYVDLEGTRRADAAALGAALAGWKARGYPGVTAVEEGMVLGMAGRVLDNREVRIVLDLPSRAEAERAVAEVHGRFGTKAEIKARLSERPWGELAVRAGGVPLGTATSYLRLVAPGGLVQVDAVEFARGYAWHGREDRSYHGEIYVAVDPDGALAVVNVQGAEAVLAGIVPAELYASSPVEALKAQAVAARNHLLSKLGRRHHDDPFRLCSEQHCQVYAGAGKEDPRASAAVEATAGQALFHGERLVECAYSASCGGHTEDNDAVWGDDADPALRARPDFDVEAHPELAAFAGPLTQLMPTWIAATPDTFCARGAAGKADRVRWTRHFGAADISRLLAPEHAGIGALRDLVVSERGPGGRVVSLELVGSKGRDTVLRELPVRKLFDNLKSGAFVIDLARDAAGLVTGVTFRGAGWGHGVGMCQLGAVGRAEAGQDYQQILSHYYGGARVERLY